MMEVDARNSLRLEIAMRSPLAAGIFGVVVATIVTFFLVRYLRSLADRMDILPFMAICLVGGALCLLIAWLWDKREAAQKARARSDQQ